MVLWLISVNRCNYEYENIIGLSNINDAIVVNFAYVNFRYLSEKLYKKWIFNWVRKMYTSHKVPINY